MPFIVSTFVPGAVTFGGLDTPQTSYFEVKRDEPMSDEDMLEVVFAANEDSLDRVSIHLVEDTTEAGPPRLAVDFSTLSNDDVAAFFEAIELYALDHHKHIPLNSDSWMIYISENPYRKTWLIEKSIGMKLEFAPKSLETNREYIIESDGVIVAEVKSVRRNELTR